MNDTNNISIINETKNRFIYTKDFERILEAFKNILKYKKPLHVDVLICDNKKIKKINKEYRNINKETDVLSFPFLFNDLSNQIGFNFLGEIILSYEKIALQAKEFNHSIKREICFLFTHGLVHLSGRDHKKSKEEEIEFNKIVYKIMEIVKITR